MLTSHRSQKNLLTILIIALLGGACQAQSPTGGTPQPSQTPVARRSPTPATRAPARQTAIPAATAAPTLAHVDPVQLRGLRLGFWHPWSGDLAGAVQSLAEEFNHENIWGLQVQVNAPGGAAVLYPKVSEAFTSAAPPAVIAASIDQLVSWQRDGRRLVDLNAYIRSQEWGLQAKEIDDYLPLFWQQDQVDGQQLGIPAERTTKLLFYNQTWARELGFSNAPSTPQEFQKQACAAGQALLKDEDRGNDGMGGWIVDRDAGTLVSWMAAFGAPLASAGERQYLFNTPQAGQALAFLRSLFDKSCAWISRNPEPYGYFSARQALFFSGHLEDLPILLRLHKHSGSADEWTAIPFPSNSGAPLLVVSGPSYAIARGTPASQLGAWLFVRFLMLPRNQARLLAAAQTLPLSESTRAQSAWSGLEAALDAMQPGPALPSWWAARNVLEDAAWQLYQPTPVPPADLLRQVDTLVPEILSNQP